MKVLRGIFIIIIIMGVCLYIGIGLFQGKFMEKDLLPLIWVIPLSVVALWQEQMKKVLFAPKLLIDFEQVAPFCQFIPPQDNLTEGIKGQYVFRFRVKTSGTGVAKRCQVIVDGMEIFENGQWIEDNTFQPVNLHWSNYPKDQVYRDIYANWGGWYCDFITVINEQKYINELRSEQTHQIAKGFLWYDLLVPVTQNQAIEANIKYKFNITVLGENVQPVSRKLEVGWSGTWTDDPNEMYKEFVIE